MATVENQVTFVKCSQSTYDTLEKDENSVYFILDTGRIYQGSHLVGKRGKCPEWEEYDKLITTSVLDEAVVDEMQLN